MQSAETGKTEAEASGRVYFVEDPSERVYCENGPRLLLEALRASTQDLEPCFIDTREFAGGDLAFEILAQLETHLTAEEGNFIGEFLNLEDPWTVRSLGVFARRMATLGKDEKHKASNWARNRIVVLGSVETLTEQAQLQLFATSRKLCAAIGLAAIILVTRAKAPSGVPKKRQPTLTTSELADFVVQRLGKALSIEPAVDGQLAATVEGSSFPTEKDEATIWQQLLTSLKKLFSESNRNDEVAPSHALPGDQLYSLATARRLAKIIAQACYPSLAQAERVVLGIERHLRDSNSNTVNTVTSVEALRAQLVLFKTIEVVFGQLIDAARSQPDGYDTLRLLFRHHAHADLTVEEKLAIAEPPWRDYQTNARLAACLHSAFWLAPSEQEPLVRLPDSTTGLRQHFEGLLDVHAEDKSRENWIKFLKSVDDQIENVLGSVSQSSRAHSEEGIKRINALQRAISEVWRCPPIAPAQGNERGAVVLAELSGAAFAYVHREASRDANKGALLNACRALQKFCDTSLEDQSDNAGEPRKRLDSAKRRLRVIELLSWLDEAQDAKRVQVGGVFKKRLDAELPVLEEVVRDSVGALRFEALTWLATAQLMKIGVSRRFQIPASDSESVSADRAMSQAQAMSSVSKERVVLIELLRGLRKEQRGEWQSAVEDYQKTLQNAENAGLREYAGRASFAMERARALSSANTSYGFLHIAQGLVRVEDTLQPFFQSERKPLFISYSRRCFEFVSAIYAELVRDSGGNKEVWLDVERIINPISELRAEMQLGLDRAGAVLLVFSRTYFESRWCSYELATALARSTMNGQRLTWILVDEDGSSASVSGHSALVDEVKRLASAHAGNDSDRWFFQAQLDALLKQEPLHAAAIENSKFADPESEPATQIKKKLANMLKPLFQPTTSIRRIGAATKQNET